MQTLRLNSGWDIYVDDAGNIATDSTEYATAQTAANAIRLFTKDAYFNQTRGIPHFDIELGKPFKASQSVLINRIRQACMAVEGVTDCRVVLEDKGGRIEGGVVYLTIGENVVTVEI